MKKHIVKRKGHIEKYDEKKVYASVYAAALNCSINVKKSENIAKSVLKKVNKFINKESVVNAHDLRDEILKNIKEEDVALMYKHHLDIC